jgi:ubiquitin conjugation factor E4 B
MRVGISHYTPLQTRPDIFEVDPATVATDSFMTNVHLILLHFAEPFMDAQYTKVSDAGLYLTLTLRDWIP